MRLRLLKGRIMRPVGVDDDGQVVAEPVPGGRAWLDCSGGFVADAQIPPYTIPLVGGEDGPWEVWAWAKGFSGRVIVHVPGDRSAAAPP